MPLIILLTKKVQPLFFRTLLYESRIRTTKTFTSMTLKKSMMQPNTFWFSFFVCKILRSRAEQDDDELTCPRGVYCQHRKREEGRKSYGLRIIFGPLLLTKDDVSGSPLTSKTLRVWRNFNKSPYQVDAWDSHGFYFRNVIAGVESVSHVWPGYSIMGKPLVHPSKGVIYSI